MISFTLFFFIFILINCEIKTRAVQELTCDDYDGGNRDPGSASTCFSLPLTNEPTGDGQKPYKCCYGEAINKNGIQVRGCHEISENNYNRLSEYIEEKKKEKDLQYLDLNVILAMIMMEVVVIQVMRNFVSIYH